MQDINFEGAFERANEMTCDGTRFDQPNYDMLIVTEENYLEALKMQAAGTAYYGTLAKEAEREVEESERKFRFRYNEMYSDCSDSLSRLGKKNNVKDVESFVQSKYEKELERMNENLISLKRRRDMAITFMEAWKQRGFTLNNMTELVKSNLLSPKQTITEEDVAESNRRMEALNRLRNK